MVRAQTIASPDSVRGPRIGLVLSGGGAKGLAQIGVLKVLDEIHMPIDVITGASMGSIIGGLYAIGYSPDSLQSIALHMNWDDLFNGNVQRRYRFLRDKIGESNYLVSIPLRKGRISLPSGLISGQKIYELLAKLTWFVHDVHNFRNLPIPFSCVATNIETGQSVNLDHGYLPQAIHASMAIPTIFQPVQINHQLLVDGGLVNDLPVKEARELGADIIIGVDVTSPLKKANQIHSLLDILNQSLRFQGMVLSEKSRKETNILIKPDIKNFNMTSFKEVQTIIDRGESAARAMLPRLKALADSINNIRGHLPYRPTVPANDSVLIRRVSIHGTLPGTKLWIRSLIHIHTPEKFSISALDHKIKRIYGSDNFNRVDYRLQDYGIGKILNITVDEKEEAFLRIGVRYNTSDNAAFLINAMKWNVFTTGSTAKLTLRLGKETQISGNYLLETDTYPRIGIMNKLTYNRSAFDFYDHNHRLTDYRVNDLSIQILPGIFLTNNLALAAGIREELARTFQNPLLNQLSSENNIYHSFTAQLSLDTFNRTQFPTRGHSFIAEADWTGKHLSPTEKFSHYTFDWQFITPVASNFSFLGRIYAGKNIGHHIPLFYQFYLGGINLPDLYSDRIFPFFGYKTNQLTGNTMQGIMFGGQLKIYNHTYLQLKANIGNTFNHWVWPTKLSGYRYGLGATLGVSTLIGPLSLTVMNSRSHSFMMDLNLGFNF